jgi:protease IV
MSNSPDNNQQTVIVKPKLGGFLWAYIIFSIPAFLSGLMWLVIVFLILVGSLAAVGGSKTSNGISREDPLNLQVVQSAKNPDGILIYDLTGAITSGNFSASGTDVEINTRKVAKDFAQIKANSNIKNVVFRMNTPGGELYASEVLGDLMSDLQTSKVKSVPNIYFDQISASGGLWSSYKTKGYIMGSPYGETGSIGVIKHIPNYKGIADKIGYSQTTIKSSASKDIGDPLRDVSADEKKYLQDQLDVYYNRFKSIVAAGRKLESSQVEAMATGLVFPNFEAKQKGLLDEIGDINKLVQKSASEANLPADYTVYKIEHKSDILSRFFQGSSILSLFQSQNLPLPTRLQPGYIYLIDETKVYN